MRTALANSVNTVAARLGAEVGLDEITETARTLGIDSELPKVPSLSLGVAELSPVELLRAYATIANRGLRDDLTVIRGITLEDGRDYARFVYHPKEVFPSAPIDLLTDMLTSVFTEGTARSAADLGFDYPAAGKTGTTSNHRDSWFAGFTPHLTAVVWVGADQSVAAPVSTNPPKKTLKITGAGAALPIWVRFMKEALSTEPPASFPVSPNLRMVTIDRYTGRPASQNCPEEQTLIEKYPADQDLGEETCQKAWPAPVKESVSERF